MKRYLNNEWVFLGFMAGILVCAFYDVQVLKALQAALGVLSSIW